MQPWVGLLRLFLPSSILLFPLPLSCFCSFHPGAWHYHPRRMLNSSFDFQWRLAGSYCVSTDVWARPWKLASVFVCGAQDDRPWNGLAILHRASIPPCVSCPDAWSTCILPLKFPTSYAIGNQNMLSWDSGFLEPSPWLPFILRRFPALGPLTSSSPFLQECLA